MKRDRFEEIRSSLGCLVSVYADRPSPGGFSALLAGLLKPLRARGRQLGREAGKSVEADAERIREQADELEGGSAPSYAFFASSVDGVFVMEPLTHPAGDYATLGPRPYLRPLRAAPRAVRSGILVADRTQARTFVALDGHVSELGPPLSADPGKPNFGGFEGYDEHVVRRRAGELSARLWREAGERLLGAHFDKPFDLLAIGGLEEAHDEIASELHPYLGQLERAGFVAQPGSLTPHQLRVQLDEMERSWRESQQMAMAEAISSAASSGGNAVLGLGPALHSTNAQATERLVVAGPFRRPGWICEDCGYLSRRDSECPVCGADSYPVDDVVSAAMDATIASGGQVTQLVVPSALDSHGVGALTRFPIGMATGDR